MVCTASISEKLINKYDHFDSFIRSNYSISYLNNKFRRLWNYLAADTGLKIIHLKRRNKLDTLISLKTAYVTSEWMHWMPKTQHAKVQLDLDYEECFNYFSTIERYEAASDLTFRNHSKLNMYYEDLIADKQQFANEICDFLELPHHPVKTLLKKQIAYPPREIITNYNDLKKAFQDTPWNIFFN
jgi:LPS sulfotransferase NodH